MPHRSHRPPARWPFWLLLAAWFCANTPQAGLHPFLSWIDDARQFSHQHRLTADVAHLLAGAKTPATVVALNDEPAAPRPAPVPAPIPLKKIDLAMEDSAVLLPPALRACRPQEIERGCPDALRAPPPHGPPRAGTRV